MKKVTNITLGNRIFAVEEDAYTVLAQYLRSIEEKFADSPDYEEIASDIEHAIADKFNTKKRSEKIAVTLADVEIVVREMGTAAEVVEEEPIVDSAASVEDSNSADSNEHTVKRTLYRDPDNAILGGVASGIAGYFSIDPVIVRLAFVVAIFFNGLGILAYVILWLIVPEAKTTTQKYAMRGEGTTVEDITKRVKKNLTDLDAKYAENAKGVWRKVRDFLSQIFALLGVFIKILLHIVQYAVGAVLMLASAVGIAALIGSVSAVWVSDGVYANQRVADMHAMLLAEPTGYVFLVASCVALLIPLLFCLLIGVSLLLGRNLFSIFKAVMLFVVWLSAVALIVALVMIHGERVAHEIREASSEWSTDTKENKNEEFYIDIPHIDDIPHIESPDDAEVPEVGYES